MGEFIPVNEPSLRGNEKKYLSECIDTGWISSEGPFIERFETEMAAYVGRKYGITVSNGTAALEAAVQALGFEQGSEIILPSFTIISCAQAITKAGLVPVVVDCERDTWNMDVSLVEEKITNKTRAIMAVHIYGITVDMEPLEKVCKKYGLKIIEDAAQAHGQTCRGKMCGSFGDISTFSFYPNKTITCGEGGMILTDDPQLAERCRSIRNLCFIPEKRFVHYEIGSNFRMTNLQAAVGVAQLERIEGNIKRKREIGGFYRQLLAGTPHLIQPVQSTPYCENIYWVYGMVLDSECEKSADDVMKMLKEYGIGTRPFFYPIHRQPVFAERGLFLGTTCINADTISQKGFYIPSGLGITNEQMEIVSECVKKVMK